MGGVFFFAAAQGVGIVGRLHVVQYSPIGEENAKERAKTLPQALRQLLIWNDDIYKGWDSLMLPADNIEAIAELEKHIRLWPDPNYYKERTICATDDEVEAIPYYYAPSPTAPEVREHYQVEESPPDERSCIFGGSIDSPVLLTSKMMLKLDFCKIKYARQPFCDLLVSPRFKEIFESAQLRGLDYLYQCELAEPLRGLVPKGEEPWICRVTNRFFTRVDELVVFQWNCKKHKVMTPAYRRLNPRRCRRDLKDSDFSLDMGFLYKGEEFFDKKWWNVTITSRVMSLLLKNKAAKLPADNRPFKSHLSPCFVGDC